MKTHTKNSPSNDKVKNQTSCIVDHWKIMPPLPICSSLKINGMSKLLDISFISKRAHVRDPLKLDLHGHNLEDAVRCFKKHLVGICNFYGHVKETVIITGRGRGSENGKPVIRPQIFSFLNYFRIIYRFNYANTGMVEILFPLPHHFTRKVTSNRVGWRGGGGGRKLSEESDTIASQEPKIFLTYFTNLCSAV